MSRTLKYIAVTAETLFYSILFYSLSMQSQTRVKGGCVSFEGDRVKRDNYKTKIKRMGIYFQKNRDRE